MSNTKHTHFIGIYNVLCQNVGTGVQRMSYHESGVREIKHLEPFAKNVGKDMTAIFKIRFK